MLSVRQALDNYRGYSRPCAISSSPVDYCWAFDYSKYIALGRLSKSAICISELLTYATIARRICPNFNGKKKSSSAIGFLIGRSDLTEPHCISSAELAPQNHRVYAINVVDSKHVFRTVEADDQDSESRMIQQCVPFQARVSSDSSPIAAGMLRGRSEDHLLASHASFMHEAFTFDEFSNRLFRRRIRCQRDFSTWYLFLLNQAACRMQDCSMFTTFTTFNTRRLS